jgi:preprotein translocase subunit SecE
MAKKNINVNTPKKGKAKGSELKKADKKFSIALAKEFINEVKQEFYKIVWPEKKHIMGTTAVVIVLVLMISLYLGAVDLILGKLIGLVIN